VASTGTVETPMKQPFRYVDDSRTGIYEIDSQHVYCDFDLLQLLLEMDAGEENLFPPRCSQIQINIDDGLVATRAAREALTQRLKETYEQIAAEQSERLDSFERRLVSRVDVLTWEESQLHIIVPVERERILVTILFGIISLVAAVLVLCILYMIVLQKTRDIGIIKAIGGSSAGLSLVFVFYGLAIGIVGSALGGTLGYLFVTNINEIQAFLVSVNPSWQVWDRAVYSFDEIPNRVDPGEMTLLLVSSVIFSMLGATLAAWRAGAMHPVEAVRHE
jgi:lipoprotein-releasing system permease protein